MKIYHSITEKVNNEKGVALLLAMMVLIMLTILGFAAIMTSTTDIKIAGNLKNASNSLSVAEGGVDEVKMRLNPLLPTHQFPQDTFPYSASWGYYITLATATQLQTSGSAYNDPGYSVTNPLTLTTSLQNSVNWQWVKVYHLTADYPNPVRIGAIQCYRPDLSPKVGACPSASYSPVEVVTAMVNVNGTQKEIAVQLMPVSSPKFKNAAFGVNSVTLSNNAATDSYMSVPGTDPATGGSCTAGTCTCAGGGIATNGSAAGAISIGGGNTKVCGTVTDGVGSTGTTISNSGTITGTPQTQTATQNTAVSTPTLPGTCTDITSAVTALHNNATLDLSVGIYAGQTCFYATGTVSLSNNQYLIFPTSASLYVTGSLTIGNNGYIYSTSHAPADLIIYGTATATSITFNNNAWVYAAVYAPTAAVTINNNGTYFGAVVGQTVNISNNGFIHYDSNLASIPGSISSYKNYAWNQLM